MLTNNINDIVEKFNNQYFYSESVGTYLISLRDIIILFDIPTYSSDIKKYLLKKSKPLAAVLSHGSCGIADGTKWQKEIGLKVYLHEADTNSDWLKMKPDVLYKNYPAFGNNIEIIHTPGHTPGSICLLEKTTGSLFTGDTVSGYGGKVRDFTPSGFNEVGYGEFNERLQACASLLKYDFNHILPFHYEAILDNAKKELEEFVTLHADG